jgi:Uma2 family endonuclease
MQPMPTTLYDLPEIEYLDGRAHQKMSPKTAHAWVQSALGAIIRMCAHGHGKSGSEWRFRPGEVDGTVTQFVPDITFVSKARLEDLRGLDIEEPPFSPDIAVEIRSPGDNLPYLRQKIERYLATGSVLVLDVDPKARRILAYSADGVREYDNDALFEHGALPWLRFKVHDAFEDLDDL